MPFPFGKAAAASGRLLGSIQIRNDTIPPVPPQKDLPGNGDVLYSAWALMQYNVYLAATATSLDLTTDLQTIYIQSDGYYNIGFSAYLPSYGDSPSVGFGYGWSGTGSGWIAVNTNRYGLEGHQNFFHQTTGQQFMNTGLLKRYLYRGDYVQGYAGGGATGVGPWAYYPALTVTKLRS